MGFGPYKTYCFVTWPSSARMRAIGIALPWQPAHKMQMDDFEPFPNLPLSFLDLADRATAQIECTGLTSDPAKMFDLAIASIGDLGAIDRMKLRSQGELLNPDTLRAHGIRANTKIGSVYWACLNDKGRADPIWSAHTLAVIINSLAYTARQIATSREVMGADCLIEKSESNMAEGPCRAVMALPLRQPAAGAPLFPLLDCSHPDQCACRYISVLPF